MKGLKQRAITALIFGIIIIGTILLNRYACIGLLAIIAGGTALEYGLVVKKSHSILLGLIAISMVGILVYTDNVYTYWAIIGMTIITMTVLASYVFRRKNNFNHGRWSYWIAAFYFGSSMGIFAREMKVVDDYSYYFIGVLVLIWLSDSGAYMVGSQWGRRKLMPKISPNKTVEGFLGSLAAVLIGGYVLSKLTPVETTDWWIIMSIVVWLTGTLGDLTQSAVKRQYEVKDTGRLLPGHGGVWDRFDSLLYVAPAVALIDQFLI